MNARITIVLRMLSGSAALLLGTVQDTPYPALSLPHECRFWGMIFTEKDAAVQQTMYDHLDSLRSLGAYNPDGWGMAYYVTPDSEVRLPVIERGEPEALLDPRYSRATEHMIDLACNAGVAHVRSGSSGPSSGIPDPHPFSRYAVHHGFHMFFAHNGTLPTGILINLITAIDPLYLSLNPPDYAPDYLDSDLYALLLTEIVDMNAHLPVEECIRIAVTKIDSAVTTGSVQCNFVMTDGTTLYAVNYSRSPVDALTLYFYSPANRIDFWAVASEPLDDQPLGWIAVPNSTLVILRPNALPRFLDVLIRNRSIVLPGFDIMYPNPTTVPVTISFTLPPSMHPNQACRIRIYDCAGRLVNTLYSDPADRRSPHTVVWHGIDEQGRRLPAGTYFCYLSLPDSSYVKKIVYVR